jgi:hypothetical protein
MARVFLGCAKAAPVGRGHKHPHSLKKRLSDAEELGDGGFARRHQYEFPSSGWMFMAHLHGGLWHFWASGFGVSGESDAATVGAAGDIAVSSVIAASEKMQARSGTSG